jgi:outer membrane protein TolC
MPPMSHGRGLIALLLLWMVAAAPLAVQPWPDTLTFERATQLWTQNNPRLRAVRAQARAEERSARAASLYPNPSLSVSEERTNLPVGVDDQWYTGITQPIRYPGEHGARRRSADATERASGALVEEVRTQLFNTLRHRYLDVVTAQARVDLLRSFTISIRSAARAARVRPEEGDLGPMRRARMQVAQVQYENDLADAERRLRDAAARYGLNVGTIQDAIDMAIGGDRVSTILEGDRRFALVGKFQETARNSVESIRNLPLETSDGAMIRLDVVCADDRVEELAEAIAETAQTGRRGDGKVFILPVAGSLDIRTGRWTNTEASPSSS